MQVPNVICLVNFRQSSIVASCSSISILCASYNFILMIALFHLFRLNIKIHNYTYIIFFMHDDLSSFM